jgi:hypothetical protein
MENRIAQTVLMIATIAATITLTTHIIQWHRYGSGTQKVKVLHIVGPQVAAVGANLAISAPYRDGLYVGKLALERNEQRQPSIGRWATQADREAFSAGYDQSEAQMVDMTGGN